MILFRFRYYTIEPEERVRLGLVDPMCEVFPKMAACKYHRYGMGGREDTRHAICILGLNMINDKVFIVLWLWHCFIVTVGIFRIFTRLGQLSSSRVRLLLMRMKLKRYLRINAHCKHIQHYILSCSIGKLSSNQCMLFWNDWLISNPISFIDLRN